VEVLVEFGAAGVEPAHVEKEECMCLSSHPDLHFSAQRVPAICNQRECGCEIDAIDMEVTLKDIVRTRCYRRFINLIQVRITFF
jgi:hypothetical protein